MIRNFECLLRMRLFHCFADVWKWETTSVCFLHYMHEKLWANSLVVTWTTCFLVVSWLVVGLLFFHGYSRENDNQSNKPTTKSKNGNKILANVHLQLLPRWCPKITEYHSSAQRRYRSWRFKRNGLIAMSHDNSAGMENNKNFYYSSHRVSVVESNKLSRRSFQNEDAKLDFGCCCSHNRCCCTFRRHNNFSGKESCGRCIQQSSILHDDSFLFSSPHRRSWIIVKRDRLLRQTPPILRWILPRKISAVCRTRERMRFGIGRSWRYTDAGQECSVSFFPILYRHDLPRW